MSKRLNRSCQQILWDFTWPPGRFMERQNGGGNPGKSFDFFNAPIRKETPPMFENDLKWPTSEQQLKVKIIYRKGVLNRPKSLVLLNVVSFNQKRLEYSQKLQFVNSIYICWTKWYFVCQLFDLSEFLHSLYKGCMKKKTNLAQR